MIAELQKNLGHMRMNTNAIFFSDRLTADIDNGRALWMRDMGATIAQHQIDLIQR